MIARNSSFTYKGRAVGVKEVGRELGVRYVLEGSLRRAGNRVRVTAQLVEAEAGSHVWADRYDRDLSDIFALQDEITEAVATAVAPAIADAERQRAVRKPPSGLDARSPNLNLRLVDITISHYLAGEYDAAVEAGRRGIRSFPDHSNQYRWLAAALGQSGHIEEAREVLAKAMAMAPAAFDMFVRRRVPWHRPEDHAHMLAGLRKAGMPEE